MALSTPAGAETGAGGRIRDTHATGTGSIMGAGTAGYCVGNLQLEGVDAPWEDPAQAYPESLASPLQVPPVKFPAHTRLNHVWVFQGIAMCIQSCQE